MKHTKHIPVLLALVLMASVTFAQTTDGQSVDGGQAENAISAARSQYARAVSTSSGVDDATVAQIYRGGPRRPFPPQRGYPRPTYRTPWMDHGSAGHILIGAAVGFGIGAALGAHNSARNGTPVSGGIIIGGGLFGFLGGCVGQAVGGFHGVHYSSARRRRVYRPSWPEDDEESDLRSHSKAKEGHPEPSAEPASPGQSAGVEAIATPLPGMATIP